MCKSKIIQARGYLCTVSCNCVFFLQSLIHSCFYASLSLLIWGVVLQPRVLPMKCLFIEAVLIPSTCLSVHCMHIQRKGDLKVPLTFYNIHLYTRSGEGLSVEIRDMSFLNFKFQILTGTSTPLNRFVTALIIAKLVKKLPDICGML